MTRSAPATVRVPAVQVPAGAHHGAQPHDESGVLVLPDSGARVDWDSHSTVPAPPADVRTIQRQMLHARAALRAAPVPREMGGV